MSSLFLDNMTRANAGTLGAGYTNLVNAWGITSNQAAPQTSGAFNVVYRSGTTTPNDQACKVGLGAYNNGNSPGAAARVGASGGYAAIKDFGVGNQYALITFNGSGSNSYLKTGAYSFTGSEIIECRCIASLISIYINSVFIDSITDTLFTSGFGGIWTFSSDANDRVTSLEIVDFGTSFPVGQICL